MGTVAILLLWIGIPLALYWLTIRPTQGRRRRLALGGLAAYVVVLIAAGVTLSRVGVQATFGAPHPVMVSPSDSLSGGGSR